MPTRADRIGTKKPWGIPALPAARDWRPILEALPTALGLELCMLARRMHLLADAQPAERGRLYPRTTSPHVGHRRLEALEDAPPELRDALRALFPADGRRRLDPAAAVAACETVSRWAHDAGVPAVALAFAEAAATLFPEDAHAAFVAGRANRTMGEAWRAEIFYTRALRHAARAQDWGTYVRARLGFGRLCTERRQFRTAARHLASAARVALDQGFEWLAAQTYHDLLFLHYQRGDFETAAHYGTRALRVYPRHHERYPVAVHDCAFLLACMGRQEEALPVLERVLAAPLRPDDRLLVCGTVARTAGQLGRAERYREAEAEVVSRAAHHPQHAPFAHVNLALGARGLGDWPRAEQHARRGARLARRLGLAQDLAAARTLLREIRARTQPAAPDTAPAPPLLAALRAAADGPLAGWRAAHWTRKEMQSGAATLGPV